MYLERHPPDPTAVVQFTLNDAGSVTYVMTKEQHKQMVTGIKAQINSQVQDMVGSKSPYLYLDFIYTPECILFYWRGN